MNHHDDEPTTAELLAIFNRAAGAEATAPTGQHEHTASTGADDEPPEAYADAALAVFERAARGFAGIAPAPQAAPVAGTKPPAARHIGDSLAADLDMVARILAETETAEQAATPDPLAAVLARLSAPTAAQTTVPTVKPAPTPEKVAQARALVDAALNDYDKIAALVPEAQTKMYAAYNRVVVDETERRCRSIGLTAGPNGEPLQSWIAATFTEKIGTFYDQRKAGTLKMDAGYNLATWAARHVMGEALKARQRSTAAAAAANVASTLKAEGFKTPTGEPLPQWAERRHADHLKHANTAGIPLGSGPAELWAATQTISEARRIMAA